MIVGEKRKKNPAYCCNRTGGLLFSKSMEDKLSFSEIFAQLAQIRMTYYFAMSVTI